MVSASRITRTFTFCHPIHLPPFAMYQAFPGSDYYGGSVAIGVAPRRQSRVSCVVDAQDGLGASFVSLRSLEAIQLLRSALRAKSVNSFSLARREYQRAYEECRVSSAVPDQSRLLFGH